MKKATIGICTYFRHEAIKTLQSLIDISLPLGWELNIVIADNSAEHEAKNRLEEFKRTSDLKFDIVHAPSSNISIARNACLDFAQDIDSDVLVFIDDDEIVTSSWLCHLIEEYTASESQVVIGPVEPIYEETPPSWVEALRLHFKGKPKTLPILTAPSCNTLIDMGTVKSLDLRFDLSLGQTGGEDNIFFKVITLNGGKISYAAEALVYEFIPSSRTRFDWFLTRKKSNGHTYARMLKMESKNSFDVIKEIIVASAKAFISLISATINLYSPIKRKYWLMRLMFHYGVVLGLFGRTEMELYGQ
ncbi:glycosyltransferase [Vibrio lentus]|uniref:Glycosyltransferase 2-like domain-containing protein n=1 Tax=Vibrio lentus TaxID=136468 RepID=A0AA45A8A9_9VIBR|nr:glycosyltransferase family 2 protein [Vibrio lentus]MCB5358426.1 glycosyltransferase family 2 protein [Vibrio lentus]MCB5448894.1 glycosyltransferase family 2 protein [Vibrio lentus]MCB5460781.1 glycosyltransferase family 2 protein [Vibrio lentus]MCC4795155.1 glycosyltransferase [Vibrio lentus]MCC4852280.1 glycosyltransferase [Vibrio lentus]